MKNSENSYDCYQKRPKSFIRSELKDISRLKKAGYSMTASFVIQAYSPRDSMELTSKAYYYPKIGKHQEIVDRASKENQSIQKEYDHYVQAEVANVSSWYFFKSDVLKAIRTCLSKRIKELKQIITNTKKNKDYGSTKSL